MAGPKGRAVISKECARRWGKVKDPPLGNILMAQIFQLQFLLVAGATEITVTRRSSAFDFLPIQYSSSIPLISDWRPGEFLDYDEETLSRSFQHGMLWFAAFGRGWPSNFA
jgi:hypothetical protein